MSRSFRKTPIVGYTTARSEKEDKRIVSGKIRAVSRARLAKKDDTPVDYREAGHGSRKFSKDGKYYLDVDRLHEEYDARYVYKLLGK